MALIACCECRREVSDRADMCPSCGNPIARSLLPALQQDARAAAATDPPKKHTALEWAISWALTAGLIIFGFALNPTAAAHREKIRSAVADHHPVASLFGVARLVALDAEYHSLGVLSFTTAQKKVVSIGAYGVVLMAPE